MKKILLFSLFLSICVQSFATVKEVNHSDFKVYRLKEGTLYNSPYLLPEPLKSLEIANFFAQYTIMVYHYPTPSVQTLVSWTYPSGNSLSGRLACKLGQTEIEIYHEQHAGANYGSFLFSGIPIQPNVEQRLTWSIGYGPSYPKFIWHGTGVGPICTVTCQPGCTF